MSLLSGAEEFGTDRRSNCRERPPRLRWTVSLDTLHNLYPETLCRLLSVNSLSGFGLTVNGEVEAVKHLVGRENSVHYTAFDQMCKLLWRQATRTSPSNTGGPPISEAKSFRARSFYPGSRVLPSCSNSCPSREALA